MPRPKQVPKEERQTIDIYYVSSKAVRVSINDPEFRGLSGIGPDAATALSNFRSVVRRRYPFAKYDLIEYLDGEPLV